MRERCWSEELKEERRMISRRIGENGGCKEKEIERKRERERETGREKERDPEKDAKREKETESIRLFVWTEDLKHVVPLYTRIVRIEVRENKKLFIGGIKRTGECAGSRKKNDAPSEIGDRDEER